MTTALTLRPEPWAVEDQRLDFLIFMHDMHEMRVLRDAFMEPDPPHLDADRRIRPSNWDRECQESGRLNRQPPKDLR